MSEENVKVACMYSYYSIFLPIVFNVREDVMVESLEIICTTAEAAHICGVSPRTITRWQELGKLIPVVSTGPGGTMRYRRADVEAMRSKHRKWGRWTQENLT